MIKTTKTMLGILACSALLVPSLSFAQSSVKQSVTILQPQSLSADQNQAGAVTEIAEDVPLGEQIEQRLAMIEKELSLQGRQMSAFKHYAEALRDVGIKMQGYQAEAQARGLRGDALEKFDLQLGLMESHMKDMRVLRSKLQSFYKVLTPEQKSIADQILVVPVSQ